MKEILKYSKSLLLYASVAVGFMSCKKEPALHPTDIKEEYVMTAGTTVPDKFRFDFFQKYRTKMLFDFELREYFYTPTSTIDSIDKVRYINDPAMYERALQFVNYHWLSYYPEAFKQKYLPLYILLANRLVDHPTQYSSSTPDSVKYAKSNGFSSLLIAGLGERMDTMSTAVRHRLRTEIHWQFLNSYLIQGNRLRLPEEFFEPSASYYFTSRVTPLSTTKADYGPAGFTIPEGTANPAGFPTRAEDVQNFLKYIIDTDEATLSAYINLAAHSRVKQKYNVLIRFFTNLGIDIRSIHSGDITLPGTLTNY